MPFRCYLCWQPSRVHEVMNQDAEHVADEIFLAVHSERPLVLRDPEQSDLNPRPVSAQVFLAQFLSPNLRHVQAAIVGGSGFGKSHLIHWMKLNIPSDKGRCVVSVPRSGTSLRSVLELLIAVLPPQARLQYQRLLNKSGSYTGSSEQRRRRLLYALATAIREDSPRLSSGEPAAERDLIENLPSLFADPALHERYLNDPNGIIARLVNHLSDPSSTYRPQEQPPHFGLEDLPLSNVDVNELAPKTGQFLSRIAGAGNLIQLALDVINRNLPAAMQQMLNFTGQDLVRLMHDIRNHLRTEGKELVLLIEDLARLDGIDNALMTALIEAPSDGPGATCNLRWAMASTTGFYERLPDTIRTRMDFYIDMDSADSEGVSVDIASFAARYLNAVRLQPAVLEDWHRRYLADSTTEVPCACADCEYRQECHAVFGSVSGIGLYPFTARALGNLADYRRVFDGAFNPRRLVKDILAEVLDNHATELADGEYPSGTLRDKMVPTGKGLPSVRVEELRRGNPTQWRRQRALLEIYGSLNQVENLGSGLYAAFDLPRVQVAGSSDISPGMPVAGQAESTVAPPRLSQTTPQLDRTLESLRSWSNGAMLTEDAATNLRSLVYDAIVSYIDWDSERLLRAFVAPATDKTDYALFRRSHIEFEDQPTQPVVQTVRKCILRLPQSSGPDRTHCAMALEGLHQFKRHGSWQFPDGQALLLATAECLDSWSRDVIAQLRQIIAGQDNWRLAALSELLAVGAVLGGQFGPEPNSDSGLIQSLFAEWPTSSPCLHESARQLYGSLVTGVSELRRQVLALTSGSKGDAAESSVIDAGTILSAVSDLRRTGALTAPVPPQSGDPIASLHARARQGLPNFVAKEKQELERWIEDLRRDVAQEHTLQGLIDELRALKEAVAKAGLNVPGHIGGELEKAKNNLVAVMPGSSRSLAEEVVSLSGFCFLARYNGGSQSISRAIGPGRQFLYRAREYLDEVARLAANESKRFDHALSAEQAIGDIRCALSGFIAAFTRLGG